MIPLQRTVGRTEIACRRHYQVFTVAAEDRAARIVPAVRHLILLLSSHVIQINTLDLIFRRTAVSQPAAVRREGHIAIHPDRCLHQGLHLLRRHIHPVHPVLPVRIDQLLAVRTPDERPDVGVVLLRQLHRFRAVCRLQVKLRLARPVGNVGNPLAVGRPSCLALVCTRCARQVLRHPLRSRHVEHLATGRHRHTLAIGRQAGSRHVRRTRLGRFPRIDQVGSQRNLHLLRLFRLRIQLIQETALLEDDPVAVRTGEFHVVIRKVGHLLHLAALRVIDEEVHHPVAVREEKDLVADPHRENVLRLVVRHVRHLPSRLVVNPDVVRHTALVIFPGAELTHDAVVGQPFAVGRIAAEATFGQGNRCGESALLIDRQQPSLETTADAVAVNDPLAVRGPAHHDVVRAHAVAQIVATVRSRIGHTQRLATGCRHDIHLRIAVVLTGERDRPAVRREAREHFVTHVRRQPMGLAACHRHLVEIAGIGEDDLLSIRSRETHQSRLFGSSSAAPQAAGCHA